MESAIQWQHQYARYYYFSRWEWDDENEERIAYGRSKGFEFSVWCNGKVVGYCCGVNLNWIPTKD